MRRISLVEIKKIELDILLHFSNFCKKHDLRYYLAGGTLLGAVRHKGYIPWDDDIDVCMPRKDYEEFKKIYKDNKFYVVKSQNVSNRPYMNLFDARTVIESKYINYEGIDHIWIDILPVDGLPSDLNKVKEIYSICDFYRKLLVLADARLGEGKSFFKKYSKYLLKPLANLYGKQRCINKIEKIAAKYPYEESEYVGIVTWGLYGAGERMLKSEFEKSIEVEFEGHKFPAFSCWDSYLRGLYGDYMQLPPIEKRKSHDMVAYLIEEEEL